MTCYRFNLADKSYLFVPQLRLKWPDLPLFRCQKPEAGRDCCYPKTIPSPHTSLREQLASIAFSDLQNQFATADREGLVEMFVTNRCNLVCDYCFVMGDGDFAPDKPAEMMSAETMQQAVLTFFRLAPRVVNLRVLLYGGEPLLAKESIKTFVVWANDFAGANDKTIRFDMTTNLVSLTPDDIEFFSNHSVNLQVSLDGSEHIHDANRKRPDGTGSFQKTWMNLTLLRESKPDYFTRHVMVQCTVTSAEPRVSRLVDFFELHDIKAVGFTSVIVGKNDPARIMLRGKDLDTFRDDFISYHIEHLKNHSVDEPFVYTHHRGFVALEELAAHRLPAAGNTACGVGVNRFAVLPDGRMAYCKSYPERTFGHVKDGVQELQLEVSRYYDRFRDRFMATKCVECGFAVGCNYVCSTNIQDRDLERWPLEEDPCVKFHSHLDLHLRLYVELCKNDLLKKLTSLRPFEIGADDHEPETR